MHPSQIKHSFHGYIPNNLAGGFTVTSTHKASLFIKWQPSVTVSLKRMSLCLPPVTLSLMVWVNLKRGSLLEKEYRIEWGNERLRVGNDSRKGTPGARWLLIIWKFISHPCLPMLFLSLVLTLSLFQMGFKKLLLNFLTSRQKINPLCIFVSQHSCCLGA